MDAAAALEDRDLAAAAAELRAATHILVAAGAGFSADSGLPVYADVAATPIWSALGLDYADLCDTTMLLSSPACAYGFWVGCLRAYRESKPHVGYHLLEEWFAARPSVNTAVYTSNVDGHFRRFGRLSERLCEIHGCVEEWMCSSSMGYTNDPAGAGATRARLGNVFQAHNAAVQAHAHACCGGGTPTQPWKRPCAARQMTPSAAEGRLLDGVCQAALDAMRCAASAARGVGGSGDGVGDDRCATNPMSCSTAAVAATAATAAGSAQGGMEAPKNPSWEELPPRCPECAAPLRPSVLMFGDDDPALLARLAASADAYQAWEEGMEVALAAKPSQRLVILELGCGTRVPSVREEAHAVLRDVVARGGRAVLIRINPDEPLGGILTATAAGSEDTGLEQVEDPLSPSVLVLRRPAASAMVRLDALMKQMDASCS